MSLCLLTLQVITRPNQNRVHCHGPIQHAACVPALVALCCCLPDHPASFKDTTANGTGDLRGMVSKVKYLDDLGVNAGWLSPYYASPRIDQGYDISDYRQIDSKYGSIQDNQELIAELKEYNIRLVMDLVANHTSDQHE